MGETNNAERAKARAKAIQKASALAEAPAAPKTPANHAFEEVLRQKRAELERLREEARLEQERRKQERQEQARQKKIRNKEERQERRRQQHAQQNNSEEGGVAFMVREPSPEELEKQAEIHALESEDPVNTAKLEIAKAEFAAIEAEKIHTFLGEQLSKLIERYGAGDPKVSKMTAEHISSTRRFLDATRGLKMARRKHVVGGYTRKRKRT